MLLYELQEDGSAARTADITLPLVVSSIALSPEFAVVGMESFGGESL